MWVRRNAPQGSRVDVHFLSTNELTSRERLSYLSCLSPAHSNLSLPFLQLNAQMGASITEPLLKQNSGEEEEHKLVDDDASYLEDGIPDRGTEEILQKTAVNHGKSSFWQTTMNCVNVLLGMGLLALPLAVEEAGWLSLGVLLAFAVICCYTGILVGRLMQRSSSMKTYQDMGGAAYGPQGRMIITVFIYMELAAFLVGNTITLGDNLARIFPNAGLNLPWLKLEPSQLLVIIAVMVALPTTWLRDMSSLSLISIGAVVTSLTVMAALAWAGMFNGVGFSQSAPIFNMRNVPLVSGIYAYCYSGHVLLPSIYSGMQTPAQFPKVLMLASFIASVIYGGTAILGVTMFGEESKSQITLNIPKHLTVGTVALWTAVIAPLSKYALGLAPVAEQLEGLLPFHRDSMTHLALGTSIRSLLVLVILAIAVALPFFHDMLALCGASVSLTTAVTFPAIFYLKVFRTSLSRTEIVCNLLCIIVGIVFAVVGTATSLRALVEKLVHPVMDLDVNPFD